MKKQIFITDFDGTLLRDDKTISRQDFKTLEILRRNNVVTAVATGRSLYSFDKVLSGINMLKGKNALPVDYVMFSTGAGIMSFPDCRILWQKSLSSLDIKYVTGYFDHCRFDYMVHKPIPDTKWFLYKFHGNHNPDFFSRVELYKDYALPLKESGHIHFNGATEVIAVIPGKADMDTIDHIKQELSRFSVIHATSPIDHKSAWIEVFHQDVSKAKSASRLCSQLGICRQNAFAVGNDYNDQDLLAWSDKGFVVENAPDDLKKKVSSRTIQQLSRCDMGGNRIRAGVTATG